ncbi:glycosyltransferase family 2 protein [soil metagenome]
MSNSEDQPRYIKKRVGRNVFDAPPKISVVIPVYNNAEFIAETIESVVNQKFREHEIIVVNDGSPDSEQLEKALKLRLDDIIYIKQRNAGAGIARNTAIEHARGDIIAFLDGDDQWLPEYLASQYVFMERHGYDMVYCDALMFGMRSAYRRTFMDTAPSNGEANFDSILDLKCNVITSGTMARKKTIVDVGLFETERVRAHDFVLWLRMAKNGAKIGYQRKPLVKYRVRLDSLSGDSVRRAERERDAFIRVRNLIDLNEQQQKTVDRRIAEFEAEIYVEQGKSLLLQSNFRDAAVSFQKANKYRRTIKLTAVALLTRLAPRTLLKFYRSNREEEIAFVPTQR